MQALPDDSSSSCLGLVRPELLTWANLVTAVRLAGSLIAYGIAMTTGDQRWNYAGLAIYWVGDVLDGIVARRLHQETVFGAEFDILADRILVSLFYVIHCAAHPSKTVVALLFLLEFMGIDHWLSNQFTRWGIKSPNEYHRVDRLTWLWLWSMPAKALNTGLVTLMTIFIESPWPAVAVIVVLIVIRIVCAWRALAMSADQRARERST